MNPTTATGATRIVIDPDVPLIRIHREFDAPPAKVYRAHVDSALYARWAGPDDVDTCIDHWDARTGGAYRYVHLNDVGDEWGFHGSFHELRPDRLIVQTFTWESDPDQVALEKLVFEDLGGRTGLVATWLVDDFAVRDGFIAGGLELGAEEGYRKLDDLLRTF